MLGRIINISTNPDFKQARKSAGFGKYLNGTYVHHSGAHDSVTLSPAVSFLNENKWLLKDIHQHPNDKMMLVLLIAGLEFSTTVDLLNINYLESLDYDVLKERHFNGEITKALTRFSVKVESLQFEEFENIIAFKGLNNLFERLFLLDLNCELDASESKIINNLLEGLQKEIRGEFDYVNSGILTFIEKLKGIKVPHKYSPEEDGDNITLLKIKTSNAELLKSERSVAKRIF